MTVYFIQEGGGDGPVKIGYTAGRGLARLKALQCANAKHLTLLSDIPGSPGDERYLHAVYNEYRVRGEWFEPVGRSVAISTRWRFRLRRDGPALWRDFLEVGPAR